MATQAVTVLGIGNGKIQMVEKTENIGDKPTRTLVISDALYEVEITDLTQLGELIHALRLQQCWEIVTLGDARVEVRADGNHFTLYAWTSQCIHDIVRVTFGDTQSLAIIGLLEPTY